MASTMLGTSEASSDEVKIATVTDGSAKDNEGSARGNEGSLEDDRGSLLTCKQPEYFHNRLIWEVCHTPLRCDASEE